MAIKHHKK